jgi:apolipoprotein N-acyltransferase
MDKAAIKASAWGLVVALFLRFGLEPLGWLCYEASHATGIGWLYWGYTVFRGAGYAFGLWPYQALACLAAGLLVSFFIMHRTRERDGT